MALRFQPARGAASFALSTAIRGPTGAAATIAAGTTTTGNAGASAAVANSGTSSAATFDFTIPRGADAGMRYSFESSTTMAAPASGGARFDNATIASAANIALNATNLDSVDVSDFLATWDNSTTTAKGYVEVRKEGAGAAHYIFSITSVTDNTSWLQIAVTYVSGSGTISASDRIYFIPYRTGDKGADGVIAGSTGANDNRILRADGVGGATLQDSAATLDDSGNISGLGTVSHSGAITPLANDGAALGSTSLSYADLFLATGGVFNWNNGNYTITHSSGVLAFSGTINPSSNDGAPLGTASLSWSDLFLASGAVINFANGNFTATHSSGALTLSGTLSLGTSNAFTCGSIELGAATDTTLSRASAGVLAVEGVNLTANVPVTDKSAAYTFVLGDANTGFRHPSTDTNARTWTIPANSSVAYPVGTTLTFLNETANVVTIAITTDTLTLVGSGSTGSRSLAQHGLATAWKVSSTAWYISGTGLT